MNSDQEGGSVFLFWSSWIAAIFRNTLLKLVQKNRKRKKNPFTFSTCFISELDFTELMIDQCLY